MCRPLCLLVAGAILVSLTSAAICAEPIVKNVWPAEAPGEKGDIGEEKPMPPQKEGRPVIRLANVSKPTITVYRPEKDKETGAAVVICPGGGYNILAMDLEGEEVAKWLNSIGVTGVVLKYRVPARKGQPRHLAPLQDAQRAVSLVRGERQGVGHRSAADRHPRLLGGRTPGGRRRRPTHDKRQYERSTTIDKVSCRPDFAVLVYPAYLTAGEQTFARDPRQRADAAGVLRPRRRRPHQPREQHRDVPGAAARRRCRPNCTSTAAAATASACVPANIPARPGRNAASNG